MATKFFICKHCGNVVLKVIDGGVTPVCCGEEMTELTANTIEGAGEKHLPVIDNKKCCLTRCCGDEREMKVKVGSEPHPMLKEHHIQFIYLETENGGQLRYLTGDEAKAKFCTCKDKPMAIYELCNIHGLWKTTLSCKTDKCCK